MRGLHMDNIEKDLSKIGIFGDFSKGKNNSLVLDLEDSDAFGKIFSLFDKTSEVELQEDTLIMNTHTANINYEYKNYLITLTADFDADNYKLIVKEKN